MPADDCKVGVLLFVCIACMHACVCMCHTGHVFGTQGVCAKAGVAWMLWFVKLRRLQSRREMQRVVREEWTNNDKAKE